MAQFQMAEVSVGLPQQMEDLVAVELAHTILVMQKVLGHQVRETMEILVGQDITMDIMEESGQQAEVGAQPLQVDMVT
jgi:hypothetical protein